MTSLSQIRNINKVLWQISLVHNLFMSDLQMIPILLKLSEKIQRVTQHYKKKASAPRKSKC